MTWEAVITALLAGAAGGAAIGVAQVFTANFIVDWRRRRADRREARMQREIAAEWCPSCGQRTSEGDHSECAV